MFFLGPAGSDPAIRGSKANYRQPIAPPWVCHRPVPRSGGSTPGQARLPPAQMRAWRAAGRPGARPRPHAAPSLPLRLLGLRRGLSQPLARQVPSCGRPTFGLQRRPVRGEGGLGRTPLQTPLSRVAFEVQPGQGVRRTSSFCRGLLRAGGPRRCRPPRLSCPRCPAVRAAATALRPQPPGLPPFGAPLELGPQLPLPPLPV